MFGQYAGTFECTDLDADVANLTFENDSATLSFVPSAGGTASAMVTNLVVGESVVSFNADFVDVTGEDAELSFSFSLAIEDDGARLDGDGMLTTGAGDIQTCDATFTRPTTG